MYDELLTAKDGEMYDYSMIGYRLANTLTEFGHVARGVCATDGHGRLVGVDERLKIMWKDGAIQYEDEAGGWREVSPDATVSMNFWGFTPSVLTEMEEGFKAFLDDAIENNPLKGEYLLPLGVDALLKAGKASVKILPTEERWFGVTYKEDKELVAASIRSMKDGGVYPEILW